LRRCQPCGIIHDGECKLSALIRRIVESDDADYETLCAATGLSRDAAYQRVHRLGLSHRIQPILPSKPSISHLGSSNKSAKLTADEVRTIRASNASGESQVALARRFGISQVTVHCIIRRKSWAHIK
jgi:predicted DNA-binding protein (UPF0251 family)